MKGVIKDVLKIQLYYLYLILISTFSSEDFTTVLLHFMCEIVDSITNFSFMDVGLNKTHLQM